MGTSVHLPCQGHTGEIGFILEYRSMTLFVENGFILGYRSMTLFVENGFILGYRSMTLFVENGFILGYRSMTLFVENGFILGYRSMTLFVENGFTIRYRAVALNAWSYVRYSPSPDNISLCCSIRCVQDLTVAKNMPRPAAFKKQSKTICFKKKKGRQS